MMRWNLISDFDKTGEFNMDFDIELTRVSKSGEAYLRLYNWKPYCISLGANQSYSDINLSKAAEDNIDVVKRPTGGRAILHAQELTYSVVIPINIGIGPKEVYAKVSLALIKGMTYYDDKLRDLKLENDQPDFPALLKLPEGKLCFGSTAKNEIKYHGRKVVGSAQRKMNNVLLQHGSILIGEFHRNLVNYINVVEPASLNLSETTIELETILNDKVDEIKLRKCLVQGFKEEFNTDFTQELSSSQLISSAAVNE